MVEATTDLTAEGLLALALDVERRLGRDRSREDRYGPRPIDIDLLVFGDERHDGANLTLPHPRLLERAFALVPLGGDRARHPDRRRFPRAMPSRGSTAAASCACPTRVRRPKEKGRRKGALFLIARGGAHMCFTAVGPGVHLLGDFVLGEAIAFLDLTFQDFAIALISVRSSSVSLPHCVFTLPVSCFPIAFDTIPIHLRLSMWGVWNYVS